MNRKSYSVIDIETTGLKPSEGDIIQICIMNFDENHNHKETKTWYFDSPNLSQLIIDLTGLTHEELKEKEVKPLKESIGEIANFVNKADLIVAQNIQFEYTWCKYNNIPFNKPMLCTMTTHQNMTQDLKAKQGLIAELYGMEHDENLAHNAIYDTEECAKIFQMQMNGVALEESPSASSPKQISFIKSLMTKNPDNPQTELLKEVDLDNINKYEAGQIINSYLSKEDFPQPHILQVPGLPFKKSKIIHYKEFKYPSKKPQKKI